LEEKTALLNRIFIGRFSNVRKASEGKTNNCRLKNGFYAAQNLYFYGFFSDNVF